MVWEAISFTRTGMKVPGPVCRVILCTSTPSALISSSRELVKWSPAVGAATAPSLSANTVWYRALSSSSASLLIYGGRGTLPIFPISSWAVNSQTLKLPLPDSKTTASVPWSKKNLVPGPTPFEGLTMHLHISRPACAGGSFSISSSSALPPDAFWPSRRAGRTLVSLRTSKSPCLRYSFISLKPLWDISPVARESTMSLEASLSRVGYWAISSSGR